MYEKTGTEVELKNEKRIREIVREEIKAAREYNQEKQEPEEYWMSMDNYGGAWIWNKKDRHPIWGRNLGFFLFFKATAIRSLHTTEIPTGLQPGMLCNAVKKWYLPNGILFAENTKEVYEITEVVECNLPIEVDWQHEKTKEKHPCSGYCTKIRHKPYLPGTDIMITCEFEEVDYIEVTFKDLQ